MNLVLSWPVTAQVTFLALSVFLLNMPFGAWRVRTRFGSLRWLLSVHIPIPFLFLLRRSLGLSTWTIVFSVIGAVLGQYLGGRIFPSESIGD